jgi:hypothetical protein
MSDAKSSTPRVFRVDKYHDCSLRMMDDDERQHAHASPLSCTAPTEKPTNEDDDDDDDKKEWPCGAHQVVKAASRG